MAAIPSLLATAAVHHHLIREGLRTSVGLVVETGKGRQLHDFCVLAGYGAEGINPYLAFDTLSRLAPTFRPRFLQQGALPFLIPSGSLRPPSAGRE